LSGRGLCDELITRPDESYRLWCVVVCDLETSRMRRPWPALGRSAKKIVLYIFSLVLWMAKCRITSTVKQTRCTIFKFIEYHATYFGRSFRPSSGVQECIHSIMYTSMSYRLVDCLLAGTRWNCMTYTWCYVYSLELLMMDGKTVRNM